MFVVWMFIVWMFIVWGLLFGCLLFGGLLFGCLLFGVYCLDVWGLDNNRCAREQGKTRGAIGFALIFLCFVSLYQDKEMKKKDKCFINAVFSWKGLGLVV